MIVADVRFGSKADDVDGVIATSTLLSKADVLVCLY